MASSTQRASSYSRTYDVFLSFRGEDTRKSFTGHLHKALEEKKIIKVFKDDTDIETGSPIRSELLTAIEESRFAIIVISPYYASSTWCLEELAKILECMKESNTIFPIFYNVDPSDVKKLKGKFGEALKEHAKDVKHAENLPRWESSLTTVGGLAGKDLANYQAETECIEEIVQELYRKLVCTGCDGRVDDGRDYLGAVWHRECLLCGVCNRPFTEPEFTDREEKPSGPYHKRCYEIQCKLCNVCKETIPVNSDGQVEYMEHSFWRQRYCPSHATDGTLRCCSCERLKPNDTTYYKLDDDRKLCSQCKESIINTDKACRSIYLEVRKFYKKLNVKVKKIPVQFVSRQAIDDKMKDGIDVSDRPLPVIRAFCFFEERTVTSCVNMGRHSQLCFDVKEILIWYGLPRILTGSLLAQQMMSAWLRLHRFEKLSPEIQKGICRYTANRWLEESMNPDSCKKLSEFEKKLCKFRKHKLESDGNELQVAKKVVCKHSLGTTLESIRKTGRFPVICCDALRH